MLKEFKEFALRGNVIELAVGVVIGAAFNAIVTSMVADIFMPVFGILTGGLDFSGMKHTVGAANITYGKFIQAIFVFIITAFALFLFIKAINRFNKKKKEEPAVAAPPPEVQLLIEIRDLLKDKKLS
jgi:large conductance mechanosensitive channel